MFLFCLLLSLHSFPFQSLGFFPFMVVVLIQNPFFVSMCVCGWADAVFFFHAHRNGFFWWTSFFIPHSLLRLSEPLNSLFTVLFVLHLFPMVVLKKTSAFILCRSVFCCCCLHSFNCFYFEFSLINLNDEFKSV